GRGGGHESKTPIRRMGPGRGRTGPRPSILNPRSSNLTSLSPAGGRAGEGRRWSHPGRRRLPIDEEELCFPPVSVGSKVMPAFLAPLLRAGVLAGGAEGTGPEGSFLHQPSYCLDDVLRLPAVPYLPQPGDVFLATTADRVIRLGHRLAGAADPHHSGLV